MITIKRGWLKEKYYKLNSIQLYMNRKKGVVLNNIGQFFIKNRRGQIWVETVIYTLIAFAMIGLVLTFVKPRIEEIRDRGVIEQSIGILKDMKSVITTIGVSGNQRVIELGINKGTLNIDGVNDSIFFEIESEVVYSQEGVEVGAGSGVVTLTEKKGGSYIVTLSTDYNSTYNIKYDGRDELRSLGKAPTPHKLILLNVGRDNLDRIIIDIKLGN